MKLPTEWPVTGPGFPCRAGRRHDVNEGAQAGQSLHPSFCRQNTDPAVSLQESGLRSRLRQLEWRQWASAAARAAPATRGTRSPSPQAAGLILFRRRPLHTLAMRSSGSLGAEVARAVTKAGHGTALGAQARQPAWWAQEPSPIQEEGHIGSKSWWAAAAPRKRFGSALALDFQR